MPSVIGVDLGGTKIDVSVFDSDSWEQLDTKRIPTKADREFTGVFEDMISAVQEFQTPDLTGVGIGVPGPVKQPEGVVLTMPNIPGATGFELRKLCEERLNVPVTVDNDANCFALAEALRGAGKNQPVVVGITLGTGVGGGVIINSRIFHGGHGYAAEIGHMLLRPGEPPYESDDKRGDVEQFLSGTALGKRCEQAKKPEEYLEGDVCSFMWPSLHKEVAWMCVNIIHLIDPSVIVFGGSAGRSLMPHLPDIEKALSEWLLPGTPVPHLAPAELKNPATLGAALLINS